MVIFQTLFESSFRTVIYIMKENTKFKTVESTETSTGEKKLYHHLYHCSNHRLNHYLYSIIAL
jgi:hypothetical protein